MIKLTSILTEAGMFRYNVDIVGGEFDRFRKNYLKLHKNNVIKDGGRFIYGFRKGNKEPHWKYDKQTNLLHNDLDTRYEKGPLTLINFFSSVKNIHPWSK